MKKTLYFHLLTHLSRNTGWIYRDAFLKSILSLCCFCLLNGIFAQDAGYCGTYDRDMDTTNNNYTGEYFDQFGNNYSEEELLVINIPGPIERTTSCASSYFNLIFSGPFTDGEIETVCAAFDYLGTVIIPASTSAQINIYITKEAFQDDLSPITDGVLATGQAFFRNDCGIRPSLAYLGVNSTVDNANFVHGIIRYNQLIEDWHLIENDGVDPEPNISGYDLFSVTIHEALHIFSWHSLTHSIDQNPISDGHYSIFDKYLFQNQQGVYHPLLVEPEDRVCCNKWILNPNLNIINSNPSICNKIKFKNDFIFLEVSVGSPMANMQNHLAHFNEDCLDTLVDYYVMHPSISSGENKRTITPVEKHAMCTMGYSIAGGGYCPENECTVIANDDGPIVISTLNTAHSIPASTYLANDVYTLLNDNPAFLTVTHIDSCGSLEGCSDADGIEVSFNSTTDAFSIVALEPGFYSICYSIEVRCGTGFFCDDAIIYIYVENPDTPVCCDELVDCNIICDGDFEAIDSTTELRIVHARGDTLGANTFTFGTWDNLPTLVSGTFEIRDCSNTLLANVPLSGSGNAVKLNHSTFNSPRKDGIMFTLCQPLDPGNSLDIDFSALASPDCFDGTPTLVFEMSSCAPVGDENVYDIPGMIAGPEVVTISTGTSMTPHNVTITNSSSQPARYLYIHHNLIITDTATNEYRSFVVLDDLVALYTESCITVTEVDVIPLTPCLEGKVSTIFRVCNTCSTPNSPFDIDIILPSLMAHVPSGSVPSLNFTIPEHSLHPYTCMDFEVLVDVGSDTSVLDVQQTIAFTIEDADTCTIADTASLSFTPVDSIPISIQKDLVWQDTIGQTGEMLFRIIICNDSEYAVNYIEVEDGVSNLIKIHDKGDFYEVLGGLASILTLNPGQCDSLYWTGIPKCICREDMENCARARVLQSGCWDIYDCVPEFDDIRTGPVPDPGFWITHVGCQIRCFGWEPNMCDECQTNIWDFGDGTSSTSFFPCHLFPDTGSYLVTHHTFNLCGDTITSDSVVIWEFRPDPTFTFESVGDCDSVQFTSSIQDLEHTWDFGNGQTSTDVNPAMTYTADGTYVVTHCVRHDTICGWVCDTLHVTIYCHGTCNCPDGVSNFNVGKFNQTTNLSTVPFATGNMHNNSGSCISVKGKLFIDKAFTLIGGEVRMHPGAEIIIPDTTGLTLQVINEYGGIHGCDSLWQGITMLPNAYLNMSRNIVQDGYESIKFQSKGKVFIVKNDFDKNHIGIQMQSSGLSLFNVAQFPREVFYDNTFDCTDDLLPAYSIHKGHLGVGLCGININKIIAVIGTDDSLFPDQNEYLNLLNGIRANESMVLIHRQYIHDMIKINQSNSYGTGIYTYKSNNRMYANRIEDMPYKGIEMQLSGSPWGVERNEIQNIAFDGINSEHFRVGHIIKNNMIYNAQRNGVALRFGSNSISNVIQSNSITIDPPINKSQSIFGISLWDIPGQYVNTTNHTNVVYNGVKWDSESSWARVYLYEMMRVGGLNCSGNKAKVEQIRKNFGFWLEENNKQVVSGNHYQNDEFGVPIYTVGYSIVASPNGLICCDTSSNALNGFAFSYHSPSRWDGNSTFDDHETGLVVGTSSIMGQQFLDQNQFNPIVQGNEWLATYSSGDGAKNFNKELDLEASLIYYNPAFTTTTALNNHQYGPGDPEGDWFKPWEESDPAFCGSEESICSSISPPVYLTDADEHAARGYFIDSITSRMALNWEVQRNLLHNVASDSTLLGTNAIIDSFYTASDSMMVSSVVYFERYLDSIRQYIVSDQARVAEYQDSMVILYAVLADLDTLIADATTLEDTLQIFDDKYTHWLSINHWLHELNEIDSLHEVRLLAGIDELINQMEGWIPENLVDSNYRIGYSHYLEVLGDPEYFFDSISLDLLYTVADQCPQYGGNIVLLCRKLIQNQNPDDYWDDELICFEDTSRTLSTNIKSVDGLAMNESIKVFPNPASDLVHIQSLGDLGPLELNVYNAVGSLIYSRNVNPHTSTSIPVDTWPDGLYTFVFKDKMNKKLVSKVAIIRN
jgi:PKD repeat protein